MKRVTIMAAVAALALSSTMASAQSYYDRGHDSREYRRDDRRDDRRDHRRDRREHRYYGERYGYNGYQGRYRTGQRYDNYRNRGYYISDYRTYNLPPPRSGYRYYRADNGDVVMAAIASGVIGLIIGNAISDNDHRDHRR